MRVSIKPPRGYNVNNLGNSSDHYFDESLLDPAMQNPSAHDEFMVKEWFDFMNLRGEELMANPNRPLSVLFASSFSSQPWMNPFAKFVSIAWESNRSEWTVPASKVTIHWYSADLCDGLSTCHQSILRFLKAVFGRQIGRKDVPSFQIALMGDLKYQRIVPAAVQSGLSVILHHGDASEFATNKAFYQNFARVDTNLFEVYLSLAVVCHDLEHRFMVMYKCESPQNHDLLLQLPALLNDPFIQMSMAVYIDIIKPSMQEPTHRWIEKEFLELSMIAQTHMHIFVGESNPFACAHFEYFHYVYPWVTGKGFLWLAAHLSFELVYKGDYLPKLMKKNPSTKAQNLLARGVPVDGFVDFLSMQSNSVEKFNSWIASNILQDHTSKLEHWLQVPLDNRSWNRTAVDGDQASKIFDAIWAISLQSGQTITKGGLNFTSTDFSWDLLRLSFKGLGGHVAFNSKTGDPYVRRTFHSLLREPSDCKRRNQFPCYDLLYGKSRSNFSLKWANCMSNQPEWSGKLSIFALGVTKRNKMFPNEASKSPATDLIKKYHNCAEERPPSTDLLCIAGEYYDPNWNLCYECPPGKFSSAGTQRQCALCQPGYFADAPGTSNLCTPCFAGFYSEKPGSTACLACPLGQMAASDGSDACDECFPGSFANALNSTACTECHPGTYQNVSQATACHRCVDPRTTLYSASQSFDDCVCPPSFFKNGKICQNCEALYGKGVVTCDGNNKPPMLNPGYMNLPNGDVVYLCLKAPHICKGNVAVGKPSCSSKLQGIACGFCPNEGDTKRVREANGECKDCGEVSWLALAAVLVVGLVGIIVKLRPKSIGYSELFVTKELQAMYLILPVIQLLDFIQTCTIYARFSVSWPSSNSEAFSLSSGIFDLSFLNLPCALGGSTANSTLRRIVVLNSLPLLFILVIMILCTPGLLIPKLQRVKFVPNMFVGINVAISMLQAFFTTILSFSLTMVFAVYKHPKDAGYSLVAFPHLLTTSAEASSMKVVAWIALFLWCAGTFFCFSLSVVLRYLCPHWIIFQRCTLALAIKYTGKSNAWVLVDMISKFSGCLIPVVFELPSEQMQYMGLLICVQVALLLFVRPYRFPRHTLNDFVISQSKIMILVLSASSLVGENSDGFAVLLVMGVAAIWTCLMVLSILYAIVVSKRVQPRDDGQTMKSLQVSFAKMLPPQDPVFTCVGDEASSVMRFHSSNDIFSMISKHKQKLEDKDDALIMKRIPASKQTVYAELRFAQLEVIRFCELGQKDAAKEALQTQREITEKLSLR